jgi:hypothetical protein
LAALAASGNDRIVALTAIAAVLTCATVALSNYWTPWLPSLPDSALFVAMIEGWGVPQHQSVGVRLYAVASAPVTYLAAGNPGLFLIIQVVLYELACVILMWAALADNDVVRHQRLSRCVLLVLCNLFPAAVFFVGSLLREYWVLVALAILSASLRPVSVSTRAIVLCVGVLMLAAARPHFLVFAPLFVVGASRHAMTVAISAGPVLLVLGASMFVSLTNYALTPEFLAMVRNVAVAGYSASGHTYGAVEWSSFLDVLMDVPLLLTQFVVAPIPVLAEVNPMSMGLYLVDAVFVILMLALCLVGMRYATRGARSLFLIAIVGLVLSSVWEFFIGGAVRHRMPFIWLLLPLASVGTVRIALWFKGDRASTQNPTGRAEGRCDER